MGRGRSARAPLSRSRVFSPRTSTTTRVPLTRPRDTRAERSKTLKARTRPGFASRHARPRMLHSACEDGPGQNRAEDRPCRRRSGSRLLSLRSVTVRAAAVSVEACGVHKLGLACKSNVCHVRPDLRTPRLFCSTSKGRRLIRRSDALVVADELDGISLGVRDEQGAPVEARKFLRTHLHTHPFQLMPPLVVVLQADHEGKVVDR